MHDCPNPQVPWEKDRAEVNGTPVNPAQDLRYYSRGLFNHPIITQVDGLRGKARQSKAQQCLSFEGLAALRVLVKKQLGLCMSKGQSMWGIDLRRLR